MKRTPRTPKHNAEMILSAARLSNAEARFIVANYYDAQERRKRCDMQLRHLGDKADEINAPFLQNSATVQAELEKTLLRGMEKFAEASPIGRWILAQHGVGPVIAAGMLAHLDITKTETAGGFWRFSGLDPTCRWEKGQKRPYNAAMKQLCYHLGECIKRTYKSPHSFYGKLYEKRKKMLTARNEEGYNAERAKTFRTASPEVKKTLKKGKLPAGNIDRQACNFVAKIFLSHLHVIMYWDKYGKAPPKPFSIAILGHAHEIKIPNLDMFPGLEEAYYGREKVLIAAE